MSQTKVTLNYTKLGGYYTLSSSNTNVVQITNNGQSFVYKGKTYTPTLEKSSGEHFGWKLNSFTMPSGSAVGTSYPSSSTKVSPYTMSDYSSSNYNYYTLQSSYFTKSLSISIDTSSGSVSGDGIGHCSYTTAKYGGIESIPYDVGISVNSSSGAVSGTNGGISFVSDYDLDDDGTTIPGQQLTKSISIDSTTGEISGDTGWCSPTISQKSVPYSETSDYQVYINSSTGYVSGAVGLCTYTKQNKGITTRTYYFKSVSWTQYIYVDGMEYMFSDEGGYEDDKYEYNVATYTPMIIGLKNLTYTASINKVTGTMSVPSICTTSSTYSSTTSDYWEFTSVNWKSPVTIGDYTYEINSISAFDMTLANYTRTMYTKTYTLDSANWISSKNGYTLSGSSSASSTTYTSDEITTHDWYITDPGWNSSGTQGGTTYYHSGDTGGGYSSNATYVSKEVTTHDYYFKSCTWKSSVSYGGVGYTYSSSSGNRYSQSATYTYTIDTTEYYLTSCTWDSTYSFYRYLSGNFSNGKQTSCTGKYYYSSSWYNPDVYVSFKWDSTNNTFTWTTSGDSSVISKIQSNFTYSVDELYNQELISTNWNFDPKLSYRFTTKDGKVKTKSALVSSTNYELIVNDDVIKFKDKFGKVTSINSIEEIKKLVS